MENSESLSVSSLKNLRFSNSTTDPLANLSNLFVHPLSLKSLQKMTGLSISSDSLSETIFKDKSALTIPLGLPRWEPKITLAPALIKKSMVGIDLLIL